MNITFLNTRCLFNEPSEYYSEMLGKLWRDSIFIVHMDKFHILIMHINELWCLLTMIRLCNFAYLLAVASPRIVVGVCITVWVSL